MIIFLKKIWISNLLIHHNFKKPYYLFQQTTKKVTTEPNVIEPEKIDEQVQPNEDIVKEHSKPVYSKQPYDDHMDSSMDDPESSNFMSYFFVLTIITVCGYLIFYNKKKVIIWDKCWQHGNFDNSISLIDIFCNFDFQLKFSWLHYYWRVEEEEAREEEAEVVAEVEEVRQLNIEN